MLGLIALTPPSRGIAPFRTEMGRRIAKYMGIEHHLLLSRCYLDYLIPYPCSAATRAVLRRSGNELIGRLPSGVKTLLIESQALSEGLQIEATPFESIVLSDLRVFAYPGIKSPWWELPQNRLTALNVLSDIADRCKLDAPVTRRKELRLWSRRV